ncbi:MAG: hypothetical protein DDT26_00833 [Dehalococcoidia bacterium]|nr:hypothetical protein [Chloroflexota bacterium]
MQLTLAGRIVPKARPRVARGHAYLPANYRKWKDAAIASLRQQLPSQWCPRCGVAITIAIGGKQRGDADNIAGAVLDALVQAGVLEDDRLACVPQLLIRHLPALANGAVITVA